MGVPALFRWLARKYPKITSKVVEDDAVEIDGKMHPVNIAMPNPNGREFDNLYLDMNGIVHPCTHPEDRPAPTNEDEAMELIFEYIDRIVSMVRPRKVLYMAIDGVAPRAKMNQQRSRRFRAALEAGQQEAADEVTRQKDVDQGGTVIEKDASPKFDSNCITPGTPFMHRLAECLRFYAADRINRKPGWDKLKIIISDASVPGEGEHKIMDYVRKQRLSPRYDPQTSHVIYGLDADLIMLALATHEPHFYVLREDVLAAEGKGNKCYICGDTGHIAANCVGKIPEAVVDTDEPTESSLIRELPKKPFVFLHVCVLREYLEYEMAVPGIPFPVDLERSLDDWVFLCFFVGNDFLPHLPSLEIRESAIDLLIEIYKRKLPKMGGYLTKDGNVNLELVQAIMEEVGEKEEEIFQRRRQGEQRRKENAKRRNTLQATNASTQREVATQREKLEKLAEISQFATSVKEFEGYQAPISKGKPVAASSRQDNQSAALALKAALNASKERPASADSVGKRKRDETESADEAVIELEDTAAKIVAVESAEDKPVALPASSRPSVDVADDASSVAAVESGEDEEEPYDEVRLWENGFRERYYQTKFEVDEANKEFRKKVVLAYAEGLCWVLRYYYQGCASWKWYYPYHYSPFAYDFQYTDLQRDLKVKFDKGTPFRPLEQLMGVLPTASKSHIPEPFHVLMTDPKSAIFDFYPEDFKIDLNGKKFAWQGVALLPFIEEKRLLKAMKTIYPSLQEEHQILNITGNSQLVVGHGNRALYDFCCDIYGSRDPSKPVPLDMSRSGGLSGTVCAYSEAVMPGSTVYSPLVERGIEDISDNTSICVTFNDPEPPKKDYEFPATLLPGVKLPPKVLSYDDYMMSKSGGNTRRSGGRGDFDQRAGRYNSDRDSRYASSGGSDYASRARNFAERVAPRNRNGSFDSVGRSNSGDTVKFAQPTYVQPSQQQYYQQPYPQMGQAYPQQYQAPQIQQYVQPQMQYQPPQMQYQPPQTQYQPVQPQQMGYNPAFAMPLGNTRNQQPNARPAGPSTSYAWNRNIGNQQAQAKK